VVVGVDFGTSTTKVVWQDLSDNHFETFLWNPGILGISGLLLPSSVVIRNNAIHLAPAEDDTRGDDIRLSSIKMCVLCRSNPSICGCGNPIAKDGIIYIPGTAKGYPAGVVACLLLAYVFSQIEARLKRQFPEEDLGLIWNVGCPMDYLDEIDRKHEWETMVGAAMALRQKVANPASISLLAEVANCLDNFVVPTQEERNYSVQPEGLAAVKAFLESPHGESKTYAIVDVGAGTTEVSFFLNGRIMTELGQPLRPSYLADSTRPIGGGRIDAELANAWNCNVEDARRQKEAGELRFPPIQTLQTICKQYEHTCCEILRSRKLVAAHNKRFDLFIIGGSGRLPPLQQALCGHVLPGDFVRENWLQLQPPKALKDRLALQQIYDLLANACGLASSISWEYYPPRAVPPMAGLPTAKKPRPDVDEYYPK